MLRNKNIFSATSRRDFRSRSDPSSTWVEKFQASKVAANASPSMPCIIGDSICGNFLRLGRKSWEKSFPGWLNCGIGGDKVQHVLWRVQNGAIPSKATSVVIIAGSNHLEGNSASEIAEALVIVAEEAIKQSGEGWLVSLAFFHDKCIS